MDMTLRPVTPDDETFLFELYQYAHSSELPIEHLDKNQREMIFRMQFLAQQQTYSTQYPAAEDKIILLDGRRVGRVLVERRESDIQGIDLAVLPEFQNKGIGSMIVQDLMAEAGATGRPFRISVVKTNRAGELYKRLGLRITGESGLHYLMEGSLIGGPSSPHSVERMTTLENLQLNSFSEHLNTKFRVSTGGDESLELELVEAKDLGSSPRQERFTLLFRGPSAVALEQKMYKIDHASLGSFDLFLVPVGARQGYREYEAVFNRLIR